ncbi:lipoprotein [Celeribacter baekdonensis B30]|uniref:Lipoprotein n=2 Tax=Celeribacter baekdonensis TaxID=875171 RepID=K2IT08_9RHOB|nr:lipoprotein [Celeribacter baekdonensis B30]
MRSIAEYFRDLAADDRYFGAEPPTPDPQMLHSIAEKEIQRRVEARMQDNSLVLRQLEDDSDVDGSEAGLDAAASGARAASQEAKVQRKKAKAHKAQAKSTPNATTPPAQETAAPVSSPAPLAQNKPAPTAKVAAPAVGNSIADKLERIRAAVAQRGEAEFVEDQQASVNFGGFQTMPDHTEVFDEIEAEQETPASVPADEPVALTEIENDFADEMTDDTATEAEESLTEEIETVQESVEPDAVSAKADDEAKLDTVLSNLQQDNDTAAQEAVAVIESTDRATPDIDVNLAADIAEASGTSAEAEIAAEDTPEDAPQDPLRRVRARVVKMRRSDYEAQPQEVEVEAETETVAETANSDADLTSALRRELGSSSLDDEAEDELMRELAEVAASGALSPEVAADILDDDSETGAIAAEYDDDSVEGDDDSQLLADEDDGEDEGDSDTRNVFATSDASMSRLMDETDREMAKGENARRRNAIQHLKAAVGAIRAEKIDKDTTAEDDDDADVYKQDLARVVRPRRPAVSGQTHRQLPPLMLVSEQRIDAPVEVAGGANITPVRPRRISTSALAVQQEQVFDTAEELDQTAAETVTEFAEFAERLGAETLPELLEAAAAYTHFVQGRDTATRPQIMRLATQAMPTDVPVEERLRSFGQLLRQGKIKKMTRGQFAVAASTRFKPR